MYNILCYANKVASRSTCLDCFDHTSGPFHEQKKEQWCYFAPKWSSSRLKDLLMWPDHVMRGLSQLTIIQLYTTARDLQPTETYCQAHQNFWPKQECSQMMWNAWINVWWGVWVVCRQNMSSRLSLSQEEKNRDCSHRAFAGAFPRMGGNPPMGGPKQCLEKWEGRTRTILT